MEYLGAGQSFDVAEAYACEQVVLIQQNASNYVENLKLVKFELQEVRQLNFHPVNKTYPQISTKMYVRVNVVEALIEGSVGEPPNPMNNLQLALGKSKFGQKLF